MGVLNGVREILGRGGPIAQRLPAYEERKEQLEMAEEVEKALEEKSHLLVEAGTGVGKSMAYLVPLIEWTVRERKRALISTYTKTLQEQLIYKDLPFLKETLGLDFNFTLSMGGENYLCLRRTERALYYGLFDSLEEAEELGKVKDNLPHLKEGLVSELDFEPSPLLWRKVSRDRVGCMGRRCPFFRDCFYQRMRKRQKKSHLLVINHHLFFAHLASGEALLPPFEAVVFDEAHNLEEVATQFLGVEISPSGLTYFLNSVFNPRTQGGIIPRLEKIGKKREEIEEKVKRVREEAEEFFSAIGETLKDAPLREKLGGRVFLNLLDEPLLSLLSSLREVEKELEEEEEKREVYSLLVRGEGIREGLKFILEQREKDWVYWVEKVKTKRGFSLWLKAAPVEVSSFLKELIWERLKPVILTSATLTTEGKFSFIKERIGLERIREVLLSSPFDFSSQVILYLPENMPDPRNEAPYLLRAGEEIKKIVNLVEGRTFVLFTSFRMLEDVYRNIKEEIFPFRILRQGEMPRYRLLKEFKKGEGMVLFAAATFWQGVDVPGRDLECVIICRLPFSVPDDPVMEARIKFLKSQRKNPFLHYQLPQAILLLRQGFGRLIRSQKDRGVVAILDPRIRMKSYGKFFLRSLPLCQITSKLEEVKKFLEREKN